MTLTDIGAGTVLDTAISGDEGGEPLLMICGTSQSYKLWTALAEAFAANGYRVICYDHRGMGDSTRGTAEISAGGLATDAVALLDALGIGRAHVLGWSLGSATAQELAIAHPERVGALVLYATWDHVDNFQRAILAGLRGAWNCGDREEAMAAIGMAFSPELLNSEAFEALMAEALPTFPQTEVQIRTTAEQWDADFAHDSRGRLESITAPTLVVAGEQDLLTPPWRGQAVADAIPGARLEMFKGPGSSHAVAFERPEEFVPLVAGFLGEHELA
ncbi:MAG: alpha/beta hydrolase [Actinomycetota bacterium]|nr:alpha/beta hydrolase [Actinomycetota bacterium]